MAKPRVLVQKPGFCVSPEEVISNTVDEVTKPFGYGQQTQKTCISAKKPGFFHHFRGNNLNFSQKPGF